MEEYQDTEGTKTFKDIFEEELEKNGLTGAEVTDNGDGSYTVTLENGNSYIIDENGILELTLITNDEITAINYGNRVNYKSQKEEKEGISFIWRIFYDDTNYVYLIASKEDGSSIENCELYSYYQNYQGSQDIEKGLQFLNQQWFNVLDGNSDTTDVGKGLAYLMDQDVWNEYKDTQENASYAIGGPSLELLINSFKATSKQNSVTSFSYDNCTDLGYSLETMKISGALNPNYNKGIYNNNEDIAIASPRDISGMFNNLFLIDSDLNSLNSLNPKNNSSNTKIRPVVLIPKDKFKYEINVYK